MMHSQIIQNRKYFPIRILYQTFQKFDYGSGVHFILLYHKSYFALVGYDRYQTDMLLFCRKMDRRSFSTFDITPAMIAVTVKPLFVTSLNFSTLFLDSFGNFRILLFQPFLNSPWILLISLSQRLLGREFPSVHIFSNCPDWHVNRVNPFYKLLYSDSGPQSKLKFQWIKYLALNQLLNLFFLRTCQGAVRTVLATSPLYLNSSTIHYVINFAAFTDCTQMKTNEFYNLFVFFSLPP